MNLFVFRLFNKNVQQKQNESLDVDRGFDDSYLDEFKRLEKQRQDSENIWEDRTYQLSAGGLSLTFAVFSFLMSQSGDNHFNWPMGIIWGVFTLCIVVNYISHRISISNFSKYIKMLEDDRIGEKKYDERVLIERYRCGDNIVSILNSFTEILLVGNIVFTVIYALYYFCNL